MNNSGNIPSPHRRHRWLTVTLLVFVVGLTGLLIWLGNVSLASNDPLFRGKPESEWIKNLKYQDDNQVKEWQSYGEAGVQVLIRGLENATPLRERAYRRFIRKVPISWRRWLPDAKPDSTYSTRLCLVSLIASLGPVAKSATPVMIQTVLDDESDSVRQSAICYFTSSEDKNCLLNQLLTDQKKVLLPALIRALQNTSAWGLRNNAAIALRFYPEQREIVAPALVHALQDAKPDVRLLAATALNCVDPDAALKAGTTLVIIAITKERDDQIAARAVSALGDPGSQPELAVPALIESLTNQNTLVACNAVWTLNRSRKEFDKYANEIIPALKIAAQRKDNVGGYAKNALANWTPKPATQQKNNRAMQLTLVEFGAF